MPDAHANFAVSQVATAPSPALSGTSLTVQAGHGTRFPSTPFNAPVCPNGVLATPLNAEIVRVTLIAGDVLTIVRAQEGSSARAIAVGDQIMAGITAKTLTDIEGTKTVARAYRTAAKTLTGAAFNKIEFDTASFDPGSNFQSLGAIDGTAAKGRYLCPTAGYYQVNADASFVSVTGDAVAIVSVFKNGVEATRGNRLLPGGGNNIWGMVVADIISCAAGDYLDFRVWTTAADQLEVVTPGQSNYLSVVRVG